MKAKKNSLDLLLEGKIDHLTTLQLVDVRKTLARVVRDLARTRLRLVAIARTREYSVFQIEKRLRHFREANESVGFLGGLRTVRERIQQIDQELLRRLIATHPQA